MKTFNKSIVISLLLALVMTFTACSSDASMGQSDASDESASHSEVASVSAEENADNSKEKPSDSSDTSDASKPEAIKDTPQEPAEVKSFSPSDIPAYSGSPYVAVNDNTPFFGDSEMTDVSFESYSQLDSLGRCGVAVASIGPDIMPSEDRENTSSVHPTGWIQAEYTNVDGGYLYNRCHILGFQLTGENANERNLITGTRSMNVDGMLLFENMVADYVQETGNHVYMRVTPIFEGDNLLASGVLMEAKSVEDDGDGVLYNVFCYNVQDGITIDYASGASSSPHEVVEEVAETPPAAQTTQTPAPQPETQSIAGIDTNGNGIVTIAEAKAAGFSMPIRSDHWLYPYMKDADGDGMVGE